MATSFVELAQEVIAEMAADTDAETSLEFKTEAATRTNPWEAPTSTTPTTQTITGFVFPPGTRRFNGELVEENKRVVYFAAADLTDVTLGLATTVTVAGKEFATDNYNRFPEGDNPALIELFIGLG